ncbi:DUF721 domain-containing protein [soil metagenome]
MARDLPTDAETREILSRKRTRPAPRPAPPAGRSLSKFVRELDDKFGRGAGALEPRWREIVGDQLARVTRPQKLTRHKTGGGTLELRVVGPAALLVQHQSADILARVNLFLGPGSVDRLRIAQGPVKPLPMTAAASTRGSRRRIEPLDAAAEADLARSVAAAPDALRAALAGLGRAVLSDEAKRAKGRGHRS